MQGVIGGPGAGPRECVAGEPSQGLMSCLLGGQRRHFLLLLLLLLQTGAAGALMQQRSQGSPSDFHTDLLLLRIIGCGSKTFFF